MADEEEACACVTCLATCTVVEVKAGGVFPSEGDVDNPGVVCSADACINVTCEACYRDCRCCSNLVCRDCSFLCTTPNCDFTVCEEDLNALLNCDTCLHMYCAYCVKASVKAGAPCGNCQTHFTDKQRKMAKKVIKHLKKAEEEQDLEEEEEEEVTSTARVSQPYSGAGAGARESFASVPLRPSSRSPSRSPSPPPPSTGSVGDVGGADGMNGGNGSSRNRRRKKKGKAAGGAESPPPPPTAEETAAADAAAARLVEELQREEALKVERRSSKKEKERLKRAEKAAEKAGAGVPPGAPQVVALGDLVNYVRSVVQGTLVTSPTAVKYYFSKGCGGEDEVTSVLKANKFNCVEVVKELAGRMDIKWEAMLVDGPGGASSVVAAAASSRTAAPAAGAASVADSGDWELLREVLQGINCEGHLTTFLKNGVVSVEAARQLSEGQLRSPPLSIPPADSRSIRGTLDILVVDSDCRICMDAPATRCFTPCRCEVLACESCAEDVLGALNAKCVRCMAPVKGHAKKRGC